MDAAVTGAWPRCSFAAGAAGDPLEGTAPQADRWLLVVHPGPWPHQALTALPADVTDALSDWEGRVVLVPPPRPAYALGGLAPAGAPAVLAAYRAGHVEVKAVRGRSAMPPVVQAAQHH